MQLLLQGLPLCVCLGSSSAACCQGLLQTCCLLLQSVLSIISLLQLSLRCQQPGLQVPSCGIGALLELLTALLCCCQCCLRILQESSTASDQQSLVVARRPVCPPGPAQQRLCKTLQTAFEVQSLQPWAASCPSGMSLGTTGGSLYAHLQLCSKLLCFCLLGTLLRLTPQLLVVLGAL